MIQPPGWERMSTKKQVNIMEVFAMWRKSEDFEMYMKFNKSSDRDPEKSLVRLLLWLISENKIIIDKEIDNECE